MALFRPYKKIEQVIKERAEEMTFKLAADAPNSSGDLADSIQYEVI